MKIAYLILNILAILCPLSIAQVEEIIEEPITENVLDDYVYNQREFSIIVRNNVNNPAVIIEKTLQAMNYAKRQRTKSIMMYDIHGELSYEFEYSILLFYYIADQNNISLTSDMNDLLGATFRKIGRKNGRDINVLEGFLDKFPQVYCHFKNRLELVYYNGVHGSC